MISPTTARAKRKYAMFLIILFVVIVIASAVFLIALLRLTLEDADFWLRPLTGALVFFTAVAGVGSLFTGYVLGNKLELRLATASKEASDAKARADSEAIKRIELEKNLAPRTISLVRFKGEENIEPLKLFAGTNVEIECLPDAEPRRLTGNLVSLLKRAEWNILSVNIREEVGDHWGEGIRIESRSTLQNDLATNAGTALLTFLTVNGIHATDFPPVMFGGTRRPANSLRIIVSLKPDPYFQEKANSEALKQTMDEARWKEIEAAKESDKRRKLQEAEERWEALRNEWRDRKATNQQPPKQSP
jgi:hypothetical protein